MAIFNCKECNIRKEVPDTFTGKQVRCPSCKRAVTVVAPPPSGTATAHALETLAATSYTPPPAPSRTADASGPSKEPSVLEIADRKTQTKLPLLHGKLVTNIVSGIEGSFLFIVFSMVLALLINEAAPGIASQDIFLGMALTSGTIFCIIMSLHGRLPVVAAGPETITCALIFLFAGFIHGRSQGLSPEQARATLLAGLILASLLTGMAAHLATRFDAGRILRFIPQPVIGGMLAMVGVLLIQGALQITMLDPFCIKALLPTIGIAECLKWIPAAATGLLFLALLHRSRSPLIYILLICLGIGIGNGLFRYWGVSIEEAHKLHLLLSPAQPVMPWTLLNRQLLMDIQWPILLEGLPYLAAATILLILSLANKIFALELLLEKEVDLNELLRSLTIANMLSGLTGALPGSISIARSMGGGSIQHKGPLAGIVAGIVCGSALFWAGPLLGYIPRFLPAGMLVFLGLSLLHKWLVATKKEFTRKDDYTLLICIFLIAFIFGILEGMAAGFLLSILVLANRYSSITVIKHLLPGSTNHSRVDRAPEQFATLKKRGNEILMMRLQGFIFLGSITPVIRTIRARLQDESQPPLKYLIMDFSRVNGLASQVAISFTQLKQLARNNRFCLIFTNVPFEVEQQLENGGFSLNEPDESSLSFVDMDYALEWCEDRILADADMDPAQPRSLESLLAPVFPEPALLSRLIPYLEVIEAKNKEYVFRQGDTADAMYFIESGMVTIQLELGGKKTTRLKKMGPGTVFGEMGIYTHAPRSASAVAEGRCRLYRLSMSTLDLMQHKEPELISALHRFMVNLLSQRVTDANFRVMDLLQ